MTKRNGTDDAIVDQDKQLAPDAGVIPVLFGDATPRGPVARPHHTQEEWLVEATEAKTVLEKGDHVSPELIEMLFLDAYDVIAGFTPPAAGRRDEKRKAHDGD